jgi:outer membrane lipoprotein-sorting protein
MRPVLALMLLPALLRADDDAEKRIRAMEKKLDSAKTIQVAFEARAEGLRESGTFKGTLTVTEGNKMHLDGSIDMDGKKVNWKKVSDGTKTTEEGLDRGTHPTPKNLTRDYRNSLTHGGFIMGVFLSSGGDGEETWPAFRVSDYELGKPDNVGTRRAQIVACKLTPVAKGEKKVDVSFSESIWLDTETNLPLKRVFTGDFGGKKITFTETYEKFLLDPKIDATLFELPK